jgi:hypothetical protein
MLGGQSYFHHCYIISNIKDIAVYPSAHRHKKRWNNNTPKYQSLLTHTFDILLTHPSLLPQCCWNDKHCKPANVRPVRYSILVVYSYRSSGVERYVWLRFFSL